MPTTVLRTFFALLTLHTWFCGMYENKTLHFMVTQKAGPLGLAVITAFGFLGFLALLDTMVELPTLRENRHLIFMAISILNAAELFVSLQYISSWGLALYCLLVSVFVAITAILDVYVRYKLPMKRAVYA